MCTQSRRQCRLQPHMSLSWTYGFFHLHTPAVREVCAPALCVPVLPHNESTFTHRCQNSSLSQHPMALAGQGKGLGAIGRFLAVHKQSLITAVFTSRSHPHKFYNLKLQILTPFLHFFSICVPLHC